MPIEATTHTGKAPLAQGPFLESGRSGRAVLSPPWI